MLEHVLENGRNLPIPQPKRLSASSTPAIGRTCLVILQGAPCGAVEILELVRVQCPEEGCESEPAEEKRNWDKPGESCHLHTFRRFDLRRTALAVTAIEELDIAIAAMSGVA